MGYQTDVWLLNQRLTGKVRLVTENRPGGKWLLVGN
jgi:hypothetical protein